MPDAELSGPPPTDAVFSPEFAANRDCSAAPVIPDEFASELAADSGSLWRATLLGGPG